MCECGSSYEEHLKFHSNSWVCEKFVLYKFKNNYSDAIKFVLDQHCKEDLTNKLSQWFYTIKFIICWYCNWIEHREGYANEIVVALGYSVSEYWWSSWDVFCVKQGVFTRWFCYTYKDSNE